ncbi:MAG: DUF6515 family protein [Prolixibacteraceae bacterium]|nr:hypothetical protein [Prolixibacteraceae bacterium]MDI9564650.1 hypothetical protein [Bacteroidota bacterium]NLT00089.1 hypothetical protein [Bacteroidales bacterium]OQB81919.1 MAG: hypothetical protein BWX87_00219 [Bacteroidetes bacterium ADurb.Bin123]HNZ69661.1 hypothetical protein [Prolixibacteraceae bacterium]
MKTRRFTLLAAIVMMGAVTGAAGQPARGEKNGNHEKNNRKELRPDERREVRGMQERKHYSADRVITPREMNMQKNAQKKGNDVRQIEKRKLREVPGHPKGKYMVGDNKFSNPPRSYRKTGYPYAYSHYYRKDHIPVVFHNNKYYRYHPKFGHTIRKFAHAPVRFWAGTSAFYYSDGFFYRHHPGIGYIWVEDPYNLWFTELPREAVRVMIAGRLYFRMGNAYFTPGLYGFRMAVLPDHYYTRGPAFAIDVRF